MLLSLFSSSNPKMALASLLLSLPVILLSLTVHEYAHGYVAYRCGDGTAKAFGRLTLNPRKHLDPIGSLCMLMVGFGWAKPVPVNMRHFRKPKRDMVLVSVAGPLSNFILAFFSAAIAEIIFILCTKNGQFAILGDMVYYQDKLGLALYFLYTVFDLGIILNVGLGLFNLIPVPPLDGSKILAGVLPNHLAMRYLQIERYMREVMLVIMLLSFTSIGDFIFLPLQWLREGIVLGYRDLFGALFEGLWKL